MALTPEVKAARREAQAEHRKAYRIRSKAFRCAADAAELQVDQLHRAALDAARSARDAAEEARQQARRDYDAAVAALGDQLEAQMIPIEAQLDQAIKIVHAAHDQWRADKKAAEMRVFDQFPDMKGAAQWSSAAWRPL